jgi:tetratricopeptide (TPR) repeat protein
MHRLPLLIVVAIVSAGASASADDAKDCFQHQEPQLRIKGCSEIIQRDPNDATAYHNRAVAYALAGDIDRAIVDYTKTIEIRPDNAIAYENRGRAYASKGDYTNAIADATQASALLAKAAARQAVIAPKAPKMAAVAPKTAAIPPKKATPLVSNVAKQASDSTPPAWTPFRGQSMD